jgi:cytochrome P450
MLTLSTHRSTIAAGADTTAVTLTSVMYYLLKNPYAHDKLLAEFQTAIRDGALSNPPRWSEVHKLPYLDVIIKESMRCYPILSFGIDRIVPDEELKLQVVLSLEAR